ncbi:MAG TPA: PhzF family phenazine biosynthesis protein [Terriglobales bacterium]
MTPRTLPFVWLDVFTDRPLEGNQLAVFTDARGLSQEQMQAIARETKLSETTFIFPREPAVELEQGVRVRIFTVDEELPFAGHPTLGTATVVRGASGADTITLDLDAGKIPVSFRDENGLAFGEMRQRDPEFLGLHRIEDVARATGLAAADIDDNLPIQTVSTGLPFTIVPVRSLAALQNLKFEWANAKEYLGKSGGRFFYFIARGAVNPNTDMHARMIFYGGEDPATGSAAGCGASWMVQYGVAKPGQKVAIEQGLECGRPSRLVVSADKVGDKVTDVRVGGTSVAIMRGELLLPS